MRYRWLLVVLLTASMAQAQVIPEALEYTEIYDFLDELATDGIIDLTEAVRPYNRAQIAAMLRTAQEKDSLLSRRQKDDVQFYLQDYALELDTLPVYHSYGHRHVTQWITPVSNLSLADPSLHILTKNKVFKMRVRPILGMDLYASKKGIITKRWYGADIQMDIAHHLSIWGSIRDKSWNGSLLNSTYFPTSGDKMYGARLTKPGYLNNLPGVQYKEANYGGDFSDSRGGIALYTWWGRIAVEREQLQWGDAQLSSNILSAHNPAVPMVSIQLTPCKWFQFDWFHAWLVSNVIDSTYYYTEVYDEGVTKIHYRPMNKFMAANMFTFKPIKYIHFSFGNSVVYAERNVQAAYFIPIAFYKSLDHLMTKGLLGVENQNSQVFGSITVRPTDHLRLYGTFYLDEFKFARLSPSNKEKNPISYVVGFQWSGWPLNGLSLKGEFMRSYIATYTHSIKVLDYTSNTYNMGHYMGDNAQSIFLQLSYRPTRSLRLTLDYTQDTKYRKYDYLRKYIAGRETEDRPNPIIAQKPFSEKTWRNDEVKFRAVYEVFNNCYAHIDLIYNNARAYSPSSARIEGEDRGWNADGTSMELSGDELQAYYLNKFSPVYLQGKNITAVMGLSFGF